mmetsp:Transcript_21035/g.21727  ORF Transcript_21035/g.21727 Transcript_21035/m.21727 type:complete len:176 (-) Transcript_21035:1261-1788(-)
MTNFNSSSSSSILSTSPNNPSILLKGVLSISSTTATSTTSGRSTSPEFTNNTKNESQLPTNFTKKSFSPESKTNNSSKKAKKRPSHAPLSSTSTSLPSSTTTNTSNYFYAGSDFMNSPDPMTIPIPNFDDVDDFFVPTFSTSSSVSSSPISTSSTSSRISLEDKTSALRRILQVK